MTDMPTLPDLVAELDRSRLDAQPLNWPGTVPQTLEQAYQAALAARSARMAAGEHPAGYKVGFTNRNLWPRYGVEAPIWGTVWESTLHQVASGAANGNAGELSLSGLCQPRIEPEIVFCLRHAPPADCSAEQLVASLDWVAHGFEIVHTHFPSWKFTAAQAVADAGLHGLLLVGHRVMLPATGINAVNLIQALAGLRLYLHEGGELKDEGKGVNVLDGPVQALLHFVRELRAMPGTPALEAGDLVTTGTLTDAHPVLPGQTWHSRIEAQGLVADQLAGLTVRFK